MLFRYQFVFQPLRSCQRTDIAQRIGSVAFLLGVALLLAAPATDANAQVKDQPAAEQTAIIPPIDGSNPALTMWYDRPAKVWMTEALPIGNGPMGAMLFGDTKIERIQFNEISLWSGDLVSKGLLGETEKEEIDNLGAHQAFGDIIIHLGHDFSKVSQYRRQLDIDRSVYAVEYVYEGTRYRQTAFASHPAGVIMVQLTADKPGMFTGDLQLTDMHDAEIVGAANRLTSSGKLKNGMAHEAQLLANHVGGTVEVAAYKDSLPNPWKLKTPPVHLHFADCDSLTLVLSLGTSFLQDHAAGWLGKHPHDAVTQRVDAAGKQSFDALLAEHVSDYQSLFGRFHLDVGSTAPEQLAKTTLKRLQDYADKQTIDPDLEALFCQFGRYLLISCSRPGALPANLQGVWNDSNLPAWAGDYHSNINLEMNQ